MNKKQIIIIVILIILASLIYLSVNAINTIRKTQTTESREVPIGKFDEDIQPKPITKEEPPKITPTPVKENYEIEKI